MNAPRNWLLMLMTLLALAGSGKLATTSRSLPEPLVRSAKTAEQAARCAECHGEIVASMRGAPHLQTFRDPRDSEIRPRFVNRDFLVGKNRFRFVERNDQLWFESEPHGKPQRVDWVLGSGQHALTPISIIDGPRGDTELLQLHVSWFADDQLGVTPGSDRVIAETASAGLWHDNAKTVACLGCHATHVPMSGSRVVFEELQAGITCARCHLHSADHADADGNRATQPAWKQLTALESINRCGECHRRADQFTTDELTTENAMLIRFAPVGLRLSACFKANDSPETRLDCLTCHDPHRPASPDSSFYAGKCAICHGTAGGNKRRCPVEPDGSRCLNCHMPKVPVGNHMTFTDHWIRIRKSADKK